jgi:hypothetical protein
VVGFWPGPRRGDKTWLNRPHAPAKPTSPGGDDGKQFSCDWTANRIPLRADMLEDDRDLPVRGLRSGRGKDVRRRFSSIILSNALSCASIHAAATSSAAGTIIPRHSGIEARFDGNVAAFGTHVEKLKGLSGSVLPRSGGEGRRFGISRVDGSHYATDVYGGAVLTRSLMAPGGIVIFDDYAWQLMNNASACPKPGIDAFLHAVCSQSRAVHRDCQLMIAKT